MKAVFEFQYNDLILSGNEEQRRVICIGSALLQNAQKKQSEGASKLIPPMKPVISF